MHDIAVIIRQSREKAGFALNQASQKLYINERTLSGYERSETIPRASTIMNMSDKYKDGFLPKNFCRFGCSIGYAYSFIPLDCKSIEAVMVNLLNYMDEAQLKLKPLRKLVGKEEFQQDTYGMSTLC